MKKSSELTLRNVCCTCLSIDRKLTQLYRVDNGVNNLFSLLSFKPEAYEAVFVKDTTQLFICWECSALMRRFTKFREQACIAQIHLTDIDDEKIDISSKIKCLSKLSHCHQESYEFVVNDDIPENFVDCGPDIDNIQTESDTDDIPLSELSNFGKINYPLKCNKLNTEVSEVETHIANQEETDKDGTIHEIDKNFFVTEMLEDEMLESIESRKSEKSHINSSNKCDSCVIRFKNYNALEKHNLKLHEQRPKHIQCDICKAYIKCKSISDHKKKHYLKYQCCHCAQVCYRSKSMAKHLMTEHGIQSMSTPVLSKKTRAWNRTQYPGAEDSVTANSGNGPIRETEEDFTLIGYFCIECNKSFQNSNQRYKHIQKSHREGFKCSICGKKFSFKNTLRRHEQIHGDAFPREQCPVCGKMVRLDLMKTHARVHSAREPTDCVACKKTFVSRASYENHLKYSRNHAVPDVLKYKCSMCEKDYRSPGELRDHVNYTHMGKTKHKCPICDKALATPRCITRHVKRAHQGLRERSLEQMCQICGRAFRDKKCLKEHELIHTGEKPLSCDMCALTFRQNASLYTHKRRVHNMAPKQKLVKHYTDDSAAAKRKHAANSVIN